MKTEEAKTEEMKTEEMKNEEMKTEEKVEDSELCLCDINHVTKAQSL